MSALGIFGLLLAGIDCLIRGILDLRQKRYIWGVLGVMAAAVIMLQPIPPYAVKVTLPMR